ncbi:MAG: HNH endonuclease, partial [Ornithinibacter sp.]
MDLVASLERVKGASSAVQARVTDAVRCSRRAVAPRDVARSVGSMVALARRESPTLGDRFVGLSRALVHEMPHTMAALTAGECSERVAVAVVAATATLSVQDRAEGDARVGPLLGGLGVRQAGAAAARVAAELDAASVVARLEVAVRSRRVTVRPA